CVCVVFLLICRLPAFTLFPYTTLFRSRSVVRHELSVSARGVPRHLERGRRLRCVLECRERHDNEFDRARRDGDGESLFRHRQCRDRKSTRLNSSHVSISYAVFCLKKKI